MEAGALTLLDIVIRDSAPISTTWFDEAGLLASPEALNALTGIAPSEATKAKTDMLSKAEAPMINLLLLLFVMMTPFFLLKLIC
jgi:hypothetical protein